jgi:hypothetical protein
VRLSIAGLRCESWGCDVVGNHPLTITTVLATVDAGLGVPSRAHMLQQAGPAVVRQPAGAGRLPERGDQHGKYDGVHDRVTRRVRRVGDCNIIYMTVQKGAFIHCA